MTARCPVVDALQPLALPLRGRALTFVRTQLAVVGGLLAIVGDSVPLIGDAFSFVGDALAPGELDFTPRKRLLAAVQLGITPRGFAPHLGATVNDHGLP